MTDEEWLKKKDYYLMNAVGITYGILSKPNIRGSNIEEESFSTETFLQKLIFIDEDFILMELDHS